jgi:pyrophosphatase PpaX
VPDPRPDDGAPVAADVRPAAVLLDLDGTLVDSIELIVASARHAFASRPGPAPTEAEFRAGIGRPLAAQFAPWVSGDDDLRFLVARYREYQLAHHDRLTTVYQGIPDALRTLHAAGHSLGVVTSKIDLMARRALDHVRLATFIRVVVACDATVRHKPDPEPVRLALERLDAGPAEAVFVGDSPYDVEAGRRAGVPVIGVTWGAYSRDVLEQAGADAIVEHPTELVASIRRLGGGAPPDGTSPPWPP